MKKQHIKLKDQDHRYLTTLLSKGNLPARVARRINGLLLLNQGLTLQAVAQQLDVVHQTVGVWRDKYQADGLDFLTDQPRSGRPPEFDGADRAKITALACSDAPDGHSQWSLRLLADKAVELELCEKISYSKVREILKKTNYNHI
jgi:transposase